MLILLPVDTVHCVQTLKDTEKNYIGILKIITELYYSEVSSRPDVFSEDDKYGARCGTYFCSSSCYSIPRLFT